MFKVKIERKIPKPVIGMRIRIGLSKLPYTISSFQDGIIYCTDDSRGSYSLCSLNEWNNNILNKVIHIL